jgi:hypothetical protein
VDYLAAHIDPNSFYIPGNDIISFFFMAVQYSTVYIYHIFFILSSGDISYIYCITWLLLIILQKIGYVLSYADLLFFRYMFKSGKVYMIVLLIAFLRKFHTNFYSGCSNTHSYIQYILATFVTGYIFDNSQSD